MLAYINMFVRACVYVRAFVHKCICESVRMCVRSHVNVCVSVYTYLCVCVFVRSCVRACVCVCACVRACVRAFLFFLYNKNMVTVQGSWKREWE